MGLGFSTNYRSKHNTQLQILTLRSWTKSATEVAECEITHRTDWFTELVSLLLELIEKRNSALKNYMKHGLTETHEILKQAWCNLKNEERKAKWEWQRTFAENANKKTSVKTLNKLGSWVPNRLWQISDHRHTVLWYSDHRIPCYVQLNTLEKF